jgi:hypothetical protein
MQKEAFASEANLNVFKNALTVLSPKSTNYKEHSVCINATKPKFNVNYKNFDCDTCSLIP